MIFKQVREIIDGQKTQTRRVVKPGERWIMDANYQGGPVTVLIPGGKIKWQVGRDYAVVAKRGTRGVAYKPDTGEWKVFPNGEYIPHEWCPLRIEITKIRREPLQNITHDDALREGILQTGYDKYMDCYCYTHHATQGVWADPVEAYCHLWDSINNRAGVRWDDNPPVWVLTFEVVR